MDGNIFDNCFLSQEKIMQITLNIPDDLPANIVQQYIKTIEAQMSLMSNLATKAGFENKTGSLDSGSEKKDIFFMSDDFDAPLDAFKPYMESVWLGIEQWRKQAQFSDGDEELTDEMIASWRDKSSGRDFSWNN